MQLCLPQSCLETTGFCISGTRAGQDVSPRHRNTTIDNIGFDERVDDGGALGDTIAAFLPCLVGTSCDLQCDPAGLLLGFLRRMTA